MRKSIKEFVSIVAETLPIAEPVYEFGSLQVPAQKDFADLRPLFAGKQYVGCDMRQGPGVDRVLNLHEIDLPDETAGTVLVLDTLEHVEFVRKAMQEVHRILKADGIAVISSVMYFPIHDHPHDYWRFTPEAFKSLLNVFSSSFVEFAGDEQFPHTVVGLGFKGSLPREHIDEFLPRVADWKKRWVRPVEVPRKKILKSIVPEMVLNMYRHIKSARSNSGAKPRG